MDTNINHTECREALISGGGGGSKVEGDMTGERERWGWWGEASVAMRQATLSSLSKVLRDSGCHGDGALPLSAAW